MVLIFTHRCGFIFEGLFICHLKSFWLGTARDAAEPLRMIELKQIDSHDYSN